jgi:hypothetical protein
MNLLFTGRGTSGSWKIRGEQLGQEMGARVRPMASIDDCQWADVIVVVKRIPTELLQRIRKSGRPWMYDIVDAYPQPYCSSWGEAESKAWVREYLAALKPDSVIWPNQKMKDDCGGSGAVLYHHHRPGIRRNPIRARIQRIGYEGSPSFMEGWMPAIERECRRIGAEFVLNPANLSDVDVILALRDRNHAGYPQRMWKSNVKLANAHGSGTPFIGLPEPGYQETASGCEYWATNCDELGTALDWLESQSAREQVSERFMAAAIPIKKVAEQYRSWIEALRF